MRALVVVWCRNRMNYNGKENKNAPQKLWFDVEIEWITTKESKAKPPQSCGLM